MGLTENVKRYQKIKKRCKKCKKGENGNKYCQAWKAEFLTICDNFYIDDNHINVGLKCKNYSSLKKHLEKEGMVGKC